MLFVCTWLWGEKWQPIYAERLGQGLKRNLKEPFRFVLVTDRSVDPAIADIVVPIAAADQEILAAPGCLVRMRMFDADWQARIGATKGDRIACVDVDVVVTDTIDRLFCRDDEFSIMQGFNGTNPCPFNGSLWMFLAGQRHDVFEDFSLQAYIDRAVPYHAFPDDQGWLHYKFPDARSYTPKDGVYAMKKIGWGTAGRRVLPDGARLVAFPGRDPAKYIEVPWVAKHWVGIGAC